VLAALLAAARRLVAPADIAQRVADNLARESEAGVRLHALLLLLREHGDHPAARAALLAARHDASAEVRLRAGIALGAEGRDVLLELAGSATAADATVAAAVAALRLALPCERAEAILAASLRARRSDTARACIERLGRAGAVDALAKVLAAERGDLAVAAARALAATGSAAARAPLLAALAAAPPPVRTAAAAALGTVGDVAAVAPLRAAAAGAGADGTLKRAVRQAVAEIHSRLSGAAPGQLSLAGDADAAGRLSLADTSESAAGRLSLAGAADEEDAGHAPPGGEPPRRREPEPGG
jgi:hypothetical protein